MKESYKNKKFKTSPPTWNQEFELPSALYSVSDIQQYLEYIVENMVNGLMIIINF